jgi:NAD(P)-dependent dehydrogenase (short-subunit alcohol dehydrogenase family)
MPTVLVTGTGLGLEFVRQYAAEGWRVIACARSPLGSPALQVLAATHPGVATHALDVTDTAAVRALARRLDGQSIDLLVNNAGVLGRPPLTGHLEGQHLGSLDYGLLAELHDTNTLGPLRMVEAFQ